MITVQAVRPLEYRVSPQVWRLITLSHGLHPRRLYSIFNA